MEMAAGDIVFRSVITKQTDVKKIGGARQKFKGRKISLVERSGISPNPADAVLFYQANKLRAMPAGVAKFDRKPEISRQLHQKFPQGLLSVRRRKGRRELNQNHLKFWPERFDCAEEGIQLGSAIAETAAMRNLAGKLAGKPETSRSPFGPTTNGVFRRSSVEGGVHFNRLEIVGVKFQPLRLRQIVRIENIAPVFEAPCARPDANFLLIEKIQMELRDY